MPGFYRLVFADSQSVLWNEISKLFPNGRHSVLAATREHISIGLVFEFNLTDNHTR